MKKILFYVIAAMFAGSVTSTVAVADDMKPKTEIGMKAKKMGVHNMAGTIEKIDHKTGMVSVKTGEGTLDVHFPPPAIKDLKMGDTITLHLSFSKGGEMMK